MTDSDTPVIPDLDDPDLTWADIDPDLTFEELAAMAEEE